MVVKRKKKSPLKVMIIVTALCLILAVAALFVTGYGDFSLNRVFDYLINGKATNEFANNTTVAVNITIQNNAAGFRIDDELERKLTAYFELYYASLGELDTGKTLRGLTKLYNNTGMGLAYDLTALDYQVNRRKNSTAALTYAECDVSVRYISANVIDKKIAEIVLGQSFSVRFDEFPNVESGISMQEHYFVFYYTKEYGWQIDRHEDRSLFGRYARAIFEDSGFAYTADSYRYTDMFKADVSDYKDFDLYHYEAPETEYPYDRNAAVKYAAANIDVIHDYTVKNKFAVYSDNSMNFVSQCINAGEIPMDAQGTGSKQWKWYSDELNHSQQSGTDRTGYSKAWVDGAAFYKYINENTGFGMVAREVPYAKAEAGDVIQFLEKESDNPIYQCIVTDKSGSELLLSANSDDMQNMPLSATGFDEIRAIKIYGYNTN